MANQVDQVLARRRQPPEGGRRAWLVAASAGLHLAVMLSFWLGPKLFAKPREPLKFVSVVVVPPSRLGTEKPLPPPPPPPPPKKEPEPEPAPPPPPPPAPVAEEVPVLPTREKEKERPQAPPPPPPPQAPPPSPVPQSRPQRQGSATGNPLGSSVRNDTVGVEDASFTYGYYLDQVVAAIGEQWVRPPVGAGKEALIHFVISREGAVSGVSLRQGSNSDAYDRAALRAVESAVLPPLPRGFKKDSLGVNVILR